MKLPKSLTTVTPLSKAIALLLFILLPFAGFYLGYKHRAETYIVPPVAQNNLISTPAPTADIANWKTIAFAKEGFSFKFPQELFFQEYPEKCFQNNQYGDFWFRAHLIVGAQGWGKDWLNSSNYQNCNVSGEDGSEFEIMIGRKVFVPNSTTNNSIKIADQNALIFYDRGKVGGESGSLISFTRNGKNYLVHIPNNKSFANGKIDPLFDEILSTFKFAQ